MEKNTHRPVFGVGEHVGSVIIDNNKITISSQIDASGERHYFGLLSSILEKGDIIYIQKSQLDRGAPTLNISKIGYISNILVSNLNEAAIKIEIEIEKWVPYINTFGTSNGNEQDGIKLPSSADLMFYQQKDKKVIDDIIKALEQDALKQADLK